MRDYTDLAVLLQDVGSNFESLCNAKQASDYRLGDGWREETDLVDQVDDWALLELRLGLAELLQGNEARVGVTQDTEAVSNGIWWLVEIRVVKPAVEAGLTRERLVRS